MPGACARTFTAATGSIFGECAIAEEPRSCIGIDCSSLEWESGSRGEAFQRNGWFVSALPAVYLEGKTCNDAPVFGACCMEVPEPTGVPIVSCQNAVEAATCANGWFSRIEWFQGSPGEENRPCRIRLNFFEWNESDWIFPHLLQYPLEHRPHDVRPSRHRGANVACRCTLTVWPFVSPEWFAAGITECLRPVGNTDPFDELCDIPTDDELECITDLGAPVIIHRDGRASFWGGLRKVDSASTGCKHIIADPALYPDGTVQPVACLTFEEDDTVRTFAKGAVAQPECAAAYMDVKFDAGFLC
jgi:hypothetical protein